MSWLKSHKNTGNRLNTVTVRINLAASFPTNHLLWQLFT